jgi:catechol 2,3-dioxygenase-like lactoylglutathione lyase family enzyme
MAIIGMHALIHTARDGETRAFLRDVLGFRSVDAGHGWLIFEAPPAEIAVHPTDGESRHELYLMCDDVDRTVAELHAKGVATRPIRELRWGRLSSIVLPGGAELGVYEPRHPTAFRRTAPKGAAKPKKRPTRRPRASSTGKRRASRRR